MKLLMLLSSLMSYFNQGPDTSGAPQVTIGGCVSLNNPGVLVSLSAEGEMADSLTLTARIDAKPVLFPQYDFQFQLEDRMTMNMTMADVGKFSDYFDQIDLALDLQSEEGAVVYFTFIQPQKKFADTIQCVARFLPGTIVQDGSGYAKIRLF